jgi:serine/threonine protein kinase
VFEIARSITILIQLRDVTSDLHSIHVVHGDLKGVRRLLVLLICKRPDAHFRTTFSLTTPGERVCDFGLASGTVGSTRPGSGPIRWMAPELFDLQDDNTSRESP